MFVILFLISSSHLPYLSFISPRILPYLIPSSSSSRPVFSLISSCFPLTIVFQYPLFPMLF